MTSVSEILCVAAILLIKKSLNIRKLKKRTIDQVVKLKLRFSQQPRYVHESILHKRKSFIFLFLMNCGGEKVDLLFLSS